MAEYRFEDIAINSTQKKKPVEEDKFHYLGLEHLDSGTFTVSRFGSEVAPIGEKLIMKKVMCFLASDEHIKRKLQ